MKLVHCIKGECEKEKNRLQTYFPKRLNDAKDKYTRIEYVTLATTAKRIIRGSPKEPSQSDCVA